jgi:hypothetical protein
MSRYHLVAPKYWPDMRGLSRDAKLLGLYLLTCEHRNTEGLYYLPLAYMADDLEMSAKVLRKALVELEGRDFISYDESARVLFIHKALTYPSQQPKTDNQVRGAMNALADVPPSPLWDAFGMAAETYAPDLAKAIADHPPNGSITPS